MMENILVRAAELSDADKMLLIYSTYVENTTVTAEYKTPSIEDFQERISNFTKKTPWLVCIIDGEIVGYSYASPHRARAAYQWSVETSIYVSKKYHRKGIATALYTAIFEILKLQGYYNIYVGITMPNDRSVAFHLSMGFEKSGAYKDSMYKFGEWRDVIWMGKSLCNHIINPLPTKTFDNIINTREYKMIIENAEKYVSER